MAQRFLNTINQEQDLQKRLHAEGWYNASGVIDFTGPYVASSIGAFGNAIAGRITYVKGITVTSTKPIQLRIIINLQNTGTVFGFPTSEIRVLVNSTPTFIPIESFIGNQGNIQFTGLSTIDTADSGTNYRLIASLNAWNLTDDLYWEAEKTYLAIGDSITYGTGPSQSKFMWVKMLRDYMQDVGNDIRYVDRGYGGMTANDCSLMVERGYFQVAKANLITWMFGVNDVATGFTSGQQATFSAAVSDFIKYKKRKYPNAKLLMFGASPVEDNTKSSNLDIARGIVSTAVSTAADPNIYYLNLGTAFTRTDLSKYTATDPTGDHKHPSDSGSSDIFNAIKTFILANNIKI